MNDEPSHPSACDCKCPYCERFRAFEDVLSRVKRPVDKAFLKNILGLLLCAEAELSQFYAGMEMGDAEPEEGEEWKQEKKPLRRPRKGDGLGGGRK